MSFELVGPNFQSDNISTDKSAKHFGRYWAGSKKQMRKRFGAEPVYEFTRVALHSVIQF